MGLGRTLEFFSDLLSTRSSRHRHKTRKQMQTVELKVRMDCEGCERKVKKTLSRMKGVKSVDINPKQQKVTVIGHVEPSKVLKRAKATGKKVEFWPYVPYSMVNHPYTVGAYDKKAPSGYVRDVDIGVSTQGSRQEDQMTNMFSDDNANSCSIM